MKFIETMFEGAWLVELAPICDDRGFFVRTFCMAGFAARGLESRFPQHSMSYSKRRGTLRGMHFQRDPHGEVKIVRCLHGAVWDVIVDLRPGSPTYGRSQGFELSRENRRQLYVPLGFAHGFQSLTDEAEVSYLISASYVPEAASGVRYDDPRLAIAWPLPVSAISEKDRGWPLLA